MHSFRVTHIRLILCLFISMLHVTGTWGRDAISSFTLSTSDGLSSALTYDLLKDEDGFLWISNQKGIDRYDGHAFKPYHLTQRSDEVLSQDDGKHHYLTQDRQGRLICYTDRGKIFRYNKVADTFDLLYSATDILNRHSLHAAATYGDTLIVGLYNGLTIIDLKEEKNSWKCCTSHNIRTIVPFSGSTFLVGSDHGFGCLNLEQMDYSTWGLEHLDIKSIYYDRTFQQIWLGTNGSGLWMMSLTSNDIHQVPNWESTIVTQILPYEDDKIIVGTDGNGLLITSREAPAPLQQIASDKPGLQYQLPGAGIQGLLIDEDKIWVTAFDRGLSLLKPESAIRCLHKPKMEQLAEPRVNDVAVDQQGHIWAAFRQSITEYNLEDDTECTYPLANSNLLTLMTASDGTIWCGGYNAGIYRFDPISKQYSHLGSLEGKSVNSSVYAIYEDHLGRIWVGCLSSPLVCFKPEAQLPHHKIPDTKQMKQYPYMRINDIGQLDDSTMVLATTDGVQILNERTGDSHSIMSVVDSTWTGINYVASIATDHSYNIYIGTDGSGLVIYNAQTGQQEQYTSHHGLPSNFIRSIECVGDSLLWISTEKEGIFSFSLSSKSVLNNVSHSRGLTNEGFHQDASAQLADGSLAFGGKGGVEIIRPELLSASNLDIRFMVSEVGLGQESRISYLTHPHILDAPITEISRINLPYGERALRLTFTAVDLYQNSDLRLLYRIGEESDYWQPLDDQRMVTIYSLPAGNHKMTIRCMRGQQIVAEKEIDIIAEQSPWLSWPAMTLYIMVGILLIFSLLMLLFKEIQQSASEEKIRFFNSVAHDIRTPLSLVLSPLADLEQYVSPHAPESLLPLIKRNLKHLNDVVNQLSLFNNGQNRLHLKIEPIQICEFITSLQEAYLPMATHRGLTLEVSVPDKGFWINADIKMLQRVIDNLLGNALKFTQKGGILISVHKHGQRAIIEVIDTGIGMSEKTRRKLFNHFFRGENAINGGIPGFGLGMMYAYQAIKQMDGRLSCQSTEGKGSTFSIQLPVAPSGEEKNYDFTEHVEEIVDQEFRPVYSSFRHDILIVEDNEELLDYMKQKLGQGYNVLCANCVDHAQKILKNNHPDLIISDIMMPGMRGDDWCLQLKQDIETSHIPVILLTANSDYRSQIHGLNMGADDYVTKPFDINLLLMKIRNIFESRRKMQAHYMQILQQSGAKKTNGSDRAQKTAPSDNDIEQKDPAITTTQSLDDQFVTRLFQIIDRYVSQPDLTIDQLESEMAMSHTLLYEKVNKILGIPPATLIRQYRMKKAKELLLQGQWPVSEVAAMCGFVDSKYFSTAFKKHFGISPSKVSSAKETKDEA